MAYYVNKKPIGKALPMRRPSSARFQNRSLFQPSNQGPAQIRPPPSGEWTRNLFADLSQTTSAAVAAQSQNWAYITKIHHREISELLLSQQRLDRLYPPSNNWTSQPDLNPPGVYLTESIPLKGEKKRCDTSRQEVATTPLGNGK